MPVEQFYDRAPTWVRPQVRSAITEWSKGFINPKVRLTVNHEGVHLGMLLEAECPTCGGTDMPRGDWVIRLPPRRMGFPHSCGQAWRPEIVSLFWSDSLLSDETVTVEGALDHVRRWVAQELPGLVGRG